MAVGEPILKPTISSFVRTDDRLQNIPDFQYSSTCHEGTLLVRSQSVPSWQVVPRGRDRNVDTNIYGHTSSAHIVCAVIMYKQNRSEMKVGRYLSHVFLHVHYSLHGINRHNKLTIVCKCSDNLFQTNVCVKCNLDRSRTHARMHAHDKIHGMRLIVLGGKKTIFTLERSLAGR